MVTVRVRVEFGVGLGQGFGLEFDRFELRKETEWSQSACEAARIAVREEAPAILSTHCLSQDR